MSKLTIYKGFNFVTGMDYNDIFNPMEMTPMSNTYGSISRKKPEQKTQDRMSPAPAHNFPAVLPDNI